MKIESAFFDSIRVKPEEDRRYKPGLRPCSAMGCALEATHRAPMGRGREGEFIWFCLDHVRDYNASYNYFNGMSDEAVAAYQKDALTGHRPTWNIGVNAKSGSRASDMPPPDPAFDPAGAFDGFHWHARRERTPDPETRAVRNAEKKALDTLGLDTGAKPAEIKARFKLLAKRNHPDANNGDRSGEDRLREIIQAYNFLKSAGLC